MTRKESETIVNRSVNKAIDNGWKSPRKGILNIFNHDFAKALWGEDKYIAYFVGYDEWSDATEIEYEEDQDYDETPHEKKPLWQYHLQQMVVAPDPIQYLKENT